jgi:hypothetical protein
VVDRKQASKKAKPKPGDLVSSADKDKKDDPNYGGDEHGDPIAKPGISEHESEEEDESMDRG